MAGVRPDRGDHQHASRVLVGLLVPTVLLLVVGRPELLVYAVFGAFAGMYGRGETGRARIIHQVQAGGLLVTGVAIGMLVAWLGAPTWLLVVIETVFAVAGSLLADAVRLRPAGPFFFIFALGATATVPGDLVPLWAGIGICAATAVFAVAVGSVGAAVPLSVRGWLQGLRLVARRPPADARWHAVRYATAVAVSGFIGVLLGFEHANWAMAAAAVPLAVIDAGRPGDGEARKVLRRATHRTVGTLVGLVFAAVLLTLHPGAAVVAIIAVALLWPTELFMTRNYALAIGFFTPLIMLMTELTSPSSPARMLSFRALDTVVGLVVGVGVALLIRPRHRRTQSVQSPAVWNSAASDPVRYGHGNN